MVAQGVAVCAILLLVAGVDRGDLRLDLSGLRGRYEQPRPQRSPGSRRVLRYLLAAAVVLAAVGVLRAVLDGGLAGLVTFLVPYVLVQSLVGLTALPALQPQTRLSPDGLDVRTDLVRRERVPWDDVRRLHPAGRWEDCAHAGLDDGRRLPLPHVPPEDVRRLAEALEAAREHGDDARG